MKPLGLILALLTRCSCSLSEDARVDDARVDLIAKHGPSWKRELHLLLDKPDQTFHPLSDGAEACVRRMPEGVVMTVFFDPNGKQFAEYVDASQTNVLEQFRRLASPETPRCRPEPLASDLGDGWFIGPLLEGSAIRNAMLRGRVDASPAGLKVDLLKGDWNDTLYLDKDRRFCSDHLVPGTYQLWVNVSHEPTGPQPYPRTALGAPIEAWANKEADAGALRLPAALPTETLEVLVRMPDGRPVAAHVDADSGHSTTGGDGVATARVLSAPSHEVRAMTDSFRFLFFGRRYFEGRGIASAGARAEILLAETDPPVMTFKVGR